jgi:hypothetical protein
MNNLIFTNKAEEELRQILVNRLAAGMEKKEILQKLHIITKYSVFNMLNTRQKIISEKSIRDGERFYNFLFDDYGRSNDIGEHTAMEYCDKMAFEVLAEDYMICPDFAVTTHNYLSQAREISNKLFKIQYAQ